MPPGAILTRLLTRSPAGPLPLRGGAPGRVPSPSPTAGLGVLAVFGAGWFVLDFVHPVGASVVAWVPVVLSALLGALVCMRTAGRTSLNAAARLFWRWLGTAALIIGLGVACNAYDAVAGPGAPTQRPGPLTTALYLGGVLSALWALLRLPVARRSRRERLTLWLDTGIVMLAAGLFAWAFAVHGSPELAATTGSSLPGLVTIMLGFVAVLTAVKLALAGAGPLNRESLSALGAAALVGATGGALMPLIQSRPDLNAAHVGVPITFLLLAIAAGRQREAEGETVRPPGRGRPFSLLPYAAIAATGGLLLVSTRTAGLETQVIAAGATVITCLVVGRQILAFYDNADLLARLDASMLELRRHERRARSLVQNSSDIIAVTAADGTLSYVSSSVERILGVPADHWLGRPVAHCAHPDDVRLLEGMRRRLMRDPGATATCQVRMRHADGDWRWLELVGANRMDDPGIRGIVSNARDITETRRVQDQLAHQATHDALTGLANRILFNERAASALALARTATDTATATVDGAATATGTAIATATGAVDGAATAIGAVDGAWTRAGMGTGAGDDTGTGAGPGSGARGVALALVDLDDFKTINDRLGHAVGDALLTVVADRLRECVGPDDTVARLGGDEFAVLLRDVSAEEADRIAGRVIVALGTPARAADHDLLVQASIGLVAGEPDTDASELLRRADVAMYAAKEQGKSRYVRYTAEMDARTVEHARLGAELQHALVSGELFLLYQPVVTLPEGELSSVEALVRWRHPERGPVSPAEFIPVAERNGMIVQIGAWVLREACRQMAEWRRRYGAAGPVRMGVNVSPRQLREPSFVQAVTDVLRETGLRPEDLLLEITETAVFDGGPALETVRALHALGVKLALDDFGTGHSSLGLLRTCPVDVLKVDKLFVDGVTGTVENSVIATSLVQIAHALQLQAVAEGVETEAQARRLYQLGYRLAQGFHFAPPLPAEGVGRLLAARAAGLGCDRLDPPALAG
ncbi:hypothetical protein GCM10014719_38540 [Planomonospora parontospora subsp. antibiotica]|nr:hypothetical protein GCM10014719_38540 [Planomonospora parontospora subsp. antibiotica]GII17153.1 hypothetical protein Ppa05_38790 [Planomonospora parontospora subsp. antibiotica]